MPVAVSRDTLAAAQLSDQLPSRDVSLRVRSEPLAVAAAKRPKPTRIARLESVAIDVRGLRCPVIATFRFTKTTLSEFGWILGKPGRRLRKNVRSLFQGRESPLERIGFDCDLANANRQRR
jgi:hypothetical protein